MLESKTSFHELDVHIDFIALFYSLLGDTEGIFSFTRNLMSKVNEAN